MKNIFKRRMAERLALVTALVWLGAITVWAEVRWPERTAAALKGTQRDFADLVREVKAQETRTIDDGLFKLEIFMRGGLEPEAIETLREMKKWSPNLGGQAKQELFRRCCRDSLWALARALVEQYGEAMDGIADRGNVFSPLSGTSESELLDHLLASGWSVERIDAWLATLPPGRDNWLLIERVRFNVAHDHGDTLVNRLMNAARETPDDFRGVFTLLVALDPWRLPPIRKKWDFHWTIDAVQPRRAADSHLLAALLFRQGDTSVAVFFYQRALEIRFTIEDAYTMGWFPQKPGPLDPLRRSFVEETLGPLAECHRVLGQADEAERCQREIAALKAKRALNWMPFEGFRGPAPSGEEIEAQEETRAGDPGYWRLRAAYYQRVGSDEKEEVALKHGLTIAPYAQGPYGGGKGGPEDDRCGLLADYASLLERESREQEAFKLLRREINEAPVSSVSRRRAVEQLNGLKAFKPEKNELRWMWLSSEPVWQAYRSALEEGVVRQVLNHSPAEKRQPDIARAMLLVQGAHPTRAYIVGTALVEMGMREQGIALLEDFVARGSDPRLRDDTRRKIFEFRLAAGDWKQAEEKFPGVEESTSLDEGVRWLGQMAVSAARGGAKADALRLWRAVLRRNPSATERLDELLKLGLRDELAAVYREMQKSLPTSRVPARMLKLLAQPESARR